MGRRFEPQLALAHALRNARQRKGYTQKQLAALANVDKTWISHLESGRVNPAWGTMRRICDALEVSISQLAAEAERIEQGND